MMEKAANELATSAQTGIPATLTALSTHLGTATAQYILLPCLSTLACSLTPLLFIIQLLPSSAAATEDLAPLAVTPEPTRGKTASRTSKQVSISPNVIQSSVSPPSSQKRRESLASKVAEKVSELETTVKK